MGLCLVFPPHARIDDDYLLYLKAQGVRTRYPQGLRDLLYYQPQGSALNQVPGTPYTVDTIYAEYEVDNSGEDNFLSIFL